MALAAQHLLRGAAHVRAIAVVLALGPVIAITSHNHAGPLSTVGLLMSPVSVDDGTLARCLAGATHSGCFLQFDLMRASMPGAVLRSLLPTAVTLVLAWACIADVGSRPPAPWPSTCSRRALPSPITWSCR